MATREVSEDNTLNMPFIAFDIDSSINGALEKATITRDGIEITVLKLDKL
ncbi:hypothetical protein [uncultured Clostridium sp.]|nr:hypothetical protein [uncultured Clostridium sp.]